MERAARPIRVFLVEDSEDDLLLIQAALAETTFVTLVATARNGEEAMAYLRRQAAAPPAARPELVLLDITMPRKNGFEVLAEMKGDPALRAVPVVMLTTSKRDEDVVAAYAGGACSFVTKPLDCSAFRDVMRSLAHYWASVARVPLAPTPKPEPSRAW